MMLPCLLSAASTTTTLMLLLSTTTSSTNAQSTANSNKPAECLPIDSTLSCAPWTNGYFINATELALVYGLQPTTPNSIAASSINVSYWDSLIAASTSGGDFQAQLWQNWAQCPGYKGEPIQYSRTYVCLTDIFLFSAGCNTQPPMPAPCPDTCDVYGKSVNVLLETTSACPTLSDLQIQSNNNITPDLVQEIDSRRSILKSASLGCKNILASWQSGSYQAHVSKSGFSSGAFAPDFVPGATQTAASCPAGQFILGVNADVGSCGFAGNLNAANAYCRDFPMASCCQQLAPASSLPSPAPLAFPPPQSPSSVRSSLRQPDSAALVSSANQSQGSSASSSSSPSPSSPALSPVAITCIVLACLIALLVPIVLLIRWSRLNNRNYSGVSPLTGDGPLMKSVPNGGGMTALPTTTSGMMMAGSRTKKYIVQHEYIQALPDELELRKGDMIDVTSIFDDGWSKGKNLTTGQEGTFPMACLRQI